MNFVMILSIISYFKTDMQISYARLNYMNNNFMNSYFHYELFIEPAARYMKYEKPVRKENQGKYNDYTSKKNYSIKYKK